MLDTLMLNNVEQRHNPLIDIKDMTKEDGTERDSMWDKLNLSQQFAVSNLGQFGYLLTYVLTLTGSTLAVLKQNNKFATINAAGTINMHPNF